MNQINHYNIPEKTGIYRLYSSDKMYVNMFINNELYKSVYYIYSEGHCISLYIKLHTINIKSDFSLYYEILENTREHVKIKWKHYILSLSKNNGSMEHTINLTDTLNNNIEQNSAD